MVRDAELIFTVFIVTFVIVWVVVRSRYKG